MTVVSERVLPRLVLGPILRHVGATEATVWVETDAACAVTVRGRTSRTFQVDGKHYALVHVTGLEPETGHRYDVRLDGVQRWPEPDSPLPPSVIRTPRPAGPRRIVFGSCRVVAPHRPPYSLPTGTHPKARGTDALVALSRRLREEQGVEWPDLLLLLGDQVYADEVPAGTREFIRARRRVDVAHGEEVADFEEYTHLYREAWSDPAVRWLLSTVPSAMIFDDHDVHDDWNTSAAWQREIKAQPWWTDRIVGAFTSYWIYQHLGNLAPDELAADDVYAAVRSVEDGADVLRAMALRADRDTASIRWSFRRDLGSTRLVVVDSRAGRVLDDDRREMLDDAEWRWLDEQLRGDVEHLLIATSLPFLLPPAIHHGESWNEAVCAGRWGRRAARIGERLRRELDMEHWAAFRSSFDRLTGMITSVSNGERGPAPATITLLSGDIHCSYLAAVESDHPGTSRIYQAVCSPIRNELPPKFRRPLRRAWGRIASRMLRGLARAAGVPPPGVRWQLIQGPCFRNALMTLTHEGSRAVLQLDRADSPVSGQIRLEPEFVIDL